MVDRFSGFPFLHRLRALDTAAVTRQLDEWFTMFGAPELIRSDGGPQFRSSFGDFCLERGIAWELSSPYNSQSNGLAESAVKAMKRLVVAVAPSLLQSAIQEWRNTPRSSDGISPSMAFFGRRTRGLLPCLPQPTLDFPSRTPAQERDPGPVLPPLSVGTSVWVQLRPGATWKKGEVRAKKAERTYLVELPNGHCYVRNRRFLRPLVVGKRAPPPASPADPRVGASLPEQPEAVVAPDDLRRSRRAAGLVPEFSALSGSRI